MSGFFGASSGLPVGSKIEIFSKVVPKGYLLCDGSRVLKSQYSKLYAVIGDNFKRLTNEYGDALTQDPLKFWLPEFSNSVFIANGRKKYAALYQSLFGSLSDVSINYTSSRYIAVVNRVYSNPTYSTSFVHDTKSSGKHYFAVRLKNVLFNASELGQLMFECVGGGGGNEGYQVSIELVRSGANTLFSNCKVYSNNAIIQSLSVLNGTIANHQEIVFFVDIGAKTGGIVVNGVTYNLVTLSTQSAYQIRTALYKNGAAASLEIGFLPDCEIMGYDVQAAKIAGYKNILELETSEFIFSEKLGSERHSHTVGGTALTIEQMPAATFQNLRTGGTNTSFVGQFDSGSSHDVGGGQTHAHSITDASNLPPHITTMFAIKYK